VSTSFKKRRHTQPLTGTLDTCLRVGCGEGTGFRNRISWYDAKTACEADNAWLAVPKFDSVNSKIATMKNQNHLEKTWIGANDQAVEGVWVDTFGDPLTYTDWYFRWKLGSTEVNSMEFSTEIDPDHPIEPDNFPWDTDYYSGQCSKKYDISRIHIQFPKNSTYLYTTDTLR